MRRITVRFLTIVLIITLSPFFNSCGTQNTRFKEMDRLFKQAFDEGIVPGVVAIVADGKRILYHNAFGKMDAKNDIDMDKNALFNIASMTKAFTSVGVMMLYERGEFELDDPVSKFIPSLKNFHVLNRFDSSDSTFTTVPADKEITIRQLLTHTSGFGYFFISDPLSKIISKTGMAWGELPLLHQPSEKWTYGISTDVLGNLIEVVTGVTLDVFFNENLFAPLGMTDTFYNIPEEKFNRLITLHRRTENGVLTESENVRPKQKNIPTGGHGIYTTATDYLKFLQMLLNGGEANGIRFISSESLNLMTTNQIGNLPVEPMISSDSRLTNDFVFIDGQDKFGFGFLINTNPEPNMRSVGSYSWVGIYNTYFWVDPNKKVAAILLTRILPFCDDQVLKLYSDFESMVYKSI